MTGTVQHVDLTRRFGFVVADETGEQVYVGNDVVRLSLRAGDRVSFTALPAAGPRPRAVDVRLLTPTEVSP